MRAGDAFERLARRLLREADFDRVNVTGQSGDGGIDRLGVYRLGLVSFRSSSSASDTAAVSAPVGVEVITHRDTVTAKLQPYPPAPRTPPDRHCRDDDQVSDRSQNMARRSPGQMARRSCAGLASIPAATTGLVVALPGSDRPIRHG